MKVYWDIDNRKLYSSNESLQEIQQFTMVLRDQEPIELHVCQVSGAALAVVDAPDGWTPKLGIKALGSYGSAALASVEIWTKTGSGTSAVYSGTIDLASAAMVAAVAASTYLDLTLEMTLQNPGGSQRSSTQCPCRIYLDVNRVDDVQPTTAAAWPWFDLFTDKTSGEECMRIKNSSGQTLAVFKPTGA